MNRSVLCKKLRSANVDVKDEIRLGNNKGTRFRLKCGAVVVLYDTGTVVVQGRGANVERLRKLVGTGRVRKGAQSQRNVLVVSGRDRASRNRLKAILRYWGLKPISLKELSEAETTADKLLSVRHLIRFAVVLATPDDVGHRNGKSATQALRPRQSVVYKLGLLTAHLGYNKVAVLAPDCIDLPPDIPDRLLVHYKKDVSSAKEPLEALLKSKGVVVAHAK